MPVAFTRRGVLLRAIPLGILTIALLGGALHIVQTLSAFRQEEGGAHDTAGWMVSQAEVEGLRFLATLDRYGLGDPSLGHTELMLRFEIFWSRLAVMQTDPVAVLTRAPGAAALVGRTIAALAAMETELSALDPTDVTAYHGLRDQVSALMPPLHQFALEIIRRADREAARGRLDHLERALLLLLTGGALAGTVLIAMIVRELLRAESERRKAADANRRLEATTESLMEALEDATAATQAKSQFLATMSHELRTPLNAVIGFAEALEAGLAGPLEGRPREYIGYIRDSGSHLLGMINEILDLSKLDARRVELRDDVIDPGEGLATALRIIRPQALECGVRLLDETQPGLPRLRADAMRMRQILLNLLSNAVKFTPANGEVRVRADNGPAGLRMVIADTGIGIAPENIPIAFQRFGQIDGSLSRKYGGTGLGLPVAKHLVELHGGTLTLESAVGVGTTVTVTFPKARVMADGLGSVEAIVEGSPLDSATNS